MPKGQTDQAYNHSYYEKNKNRLQARKKRRYDNDPSYKAKALIRRKEQRERDKLRRKMGPPQPKKAAREPKQMRIKLTDGTEVIVGMYSIGQAAYRVGVSSYTLRKWEQQAIIPPALYRSKGGHRLYTEDQVVVMRDVYNDYRRDKPSSAKITDGFVRQMHLRLASLDMGVNKDAMGEEDDE